MTKSEIREIKSIETYIAYGMIDTAARAASALVRCARSTKARNDLLTYFAEWPAVIQHPEFIV